jgi:hypothetical protein
VTSIWMVGGEVVWREGAPTPSTSPKPAAFAEQLAAEPSPLEGARTVRLLLPPRLVRRLGSAGRRPLHPLQLSHLSDDREPRRGPHPQKRPDRRKPGPK